MNKQYVFSSGEGRCLYLNFNFLYINENGLTVQCWTPLCLLSPIIVFSIIVWNKELNVNKSQGEMRVWIN